MARFYQFPYNYRTGSMSQKTDRNWNPTGSVPELSDGRDDTSVTIADDGHRYLLTLPESLPINSIFLVTTSGITSVTVSDGGSNNVTIPLPTMANSPTSFRDNRRYTIDHSATLLGGFSSSVVRLNFVGSGSIYGVALSSHLFNVEEDEHWTEINHRRSMEGAARRRNIRGDSITIPGRGGRWKWRTDYTGYFGQDFSASMDRLVRGIEKNPNFFYQPLPNNEPTIFYPATVSPSEMQISYVGGLLTQRQIRFTIQEL